MTNMTLCDRIQQAGTIEFNSHCCFYKSGGFLLVQFTSFNSFTSFLLLKKKLLPNSKNIFSQAGYAYREGQLNLVCMAELTLPNGSKENQSGGCCINESKKIYIRQWKNSADLWYSSYKTYVEVLIEPLSPYSFIKTTLEI